MGLKERLHGAIVCSLLPAPCIGTQRALPYGSVRRVALFTVVAALAVLSAPSSLLAKGATVRVVITGPDIPQSIEIAEANTLTAFNVWTGPGPSSNEDVGFIVKWSQTVGQP